MYDGIENVTGTTTHKPLSSQMNNQIFGQTGKIIEHNFGNLIAQHSYVYVFSISHTRIESTSTLKLTELQWTCCSETSTIS